MEREPTSNGVPSFALFGWSTAHAGKRLNPINAKGGSLGHQR